MEPLVYTPDEAAAALKTSPNVIYDLLNSGQIKAYKPNRNWKIPRKALEEYVMSLSEKETEERKCQKKSSP